jgi:hypothetical protein
MSSVNGPASLLENLMKELDLLAFHNSWAVQEWHLRKGFAMQLTFYQSIKKISLEGGQLKTAARWGGTFGSAPDHGQAASTLHWYIRAEAQWGPVTPGRALDFPHCRFTLPLVTVMWLGTRILFSFRPGMLRT